MWCSSVVIVHRPLEKAQIQLSVTCLHHLCSLELWVMPGHGTLSQASRGAAPVTAGLGQQLTPALPRWASSRVGFTTKCSSQGRAGFLPRYFPVLCAGRMGSREQTRGASSLWKDAQKIPPGCTPRSEQAFPTPVPTPARQHRQGVWYRLIWCRSNVGVLDRGLPGHTGDS